MLLLNYSSVYKNRRSLTTWNSHHITARGQTTHTSEIIILPQEKYVPSRRLRKEDLVHTYFP